VTVLLPLFFVGIGLTTSVGLVGTSFQHVAVFCATLVIAITTKIVGAGVGARLAGLGGRDALRVGVLMNCRGVTELVVASIGYHVNLINRFGFTVLVLTALTTTLSTAPLIRVLNRRGSGEHGIAEVVAATGPPTAGPDGPAGGSMSR
jgi:Kef-type K+ transport system membrane component KefB